MNALRAVTLKLSLLLSLCPGLAWAESTVPTELESNYVLSPKGCTGLNPDPDQDSLFVVLSFDDVLKLDGEKIVAGNPEKVMFVVVPCRMKASLEACSSQRGVFKLSQTSGLFSFPQSNEFACKPSSASK